MELPINEICVFSHYMFIVTEDNYNDYYFELT